MILLSVCVTLSAFSIYGQEAKGGLVLVTPKPVEKPKEETKIPVPPAKMTNAISGKPKVYDGYLAEALRAENKRALLDLSVPLDPRKDLENVFFNSSPDLAKPIILFRIKF